MCRHRKRGFRLDIMISIESLCRQVDEELLFQLVLQICYCLLCRVM